MCTSGAVRLGTGDYVLFKNKDFGRSYYEDRLVVRRAWWGALGLETFAATPGTPNTYSGLSIGANPHGLFCCSNHVKSTGKNGINYDLLVEEALSQGHNVASALTAVKKRLTHTPGWWGNLILTDGCHFAAAEVRGQTVRVAHSQDRIVRTNHQPLFSEQASCDGISCSKPRFAAAQACLAKISSLDDVFALLSAHDEGKTGICNHGPMLTTVYSYILRRRGEETVLYVSQGHPCRYHRQILKVPVGASWSKTAAQQFIQDYPTRETISAVVLP